MDRLKQYKQKLFIMTYILDDEEDVVQNLREILEKEGVEGMFFTSASDLLTHLNESMHICILDYILPGTNGEAVLRKIKEVNKKCYVIGLTGLQDRKALRRWYNAGLQKLVDKNEPDYMEELTAYVKEAVEGIKDEHEYYSKLLKKIESYEEKAL